VDGIELTAPIGKSHHVVIQFKFYCYIEQVKEQQPRYIYHKGDYNNMCIEASQMDWNVPPHYDVETSWRSLTNNLKMLMDKYIPKTKPGKPRKKRPPYMTQKAIEKVKEKTNSSKRGEFPGRAPTTTDMQGHETKPNGNAGERKRILR